jgi:hypothetical protein
MTMPVGLVIEAVLGLDDMTAELPPRRMRGSRVERSESKKQQHRFFDALDAEGAGWPFLARTRNMFRWVAKSLVDEGERQELTEAAVAVVGLGTTRLVRVVCSSGR